MWKSLAPLLAKEREKGILRGLQVPSGILAHDPGYIDKAREIIVGLQTDALLAKRAIMPFGGWRVVANSLEAYGYKPDRPSARSSPSTRRTHNDGEFDAYTPGDPEGPLVGIRHRPAGCVRSRPHHRRLPPGRALRVDFLVADKQREKKELTTATPPRTR